MKKTLQLLAVLLTFALSHKAIGQDVNLNKGDISIMKDEKSINIEFSYENMTISDYGKEEKFIRIKKEEHNAKVPGSGDKWAQDWEDDKKGKFEPRFIERFTEASKLTLNKEAKYTLVFRTKTIEGGYSIGISKKNATIDGEAWIVETANKTKKLVTFTIDAAPESMWRGAAFDSGDRISQAYMLAAKALGKFIKKESKKSD